VPDVDNEALHLSTILLERDTSIPLEHVLGIRISHTMNVANTVLKDNGSAFRADRWGNVFKGSEHADPV
jgi:hypothetical protein